MRNVNREKLSFGLVIRYMQIIAKGIVTQAMSEAAIVDAEETDTGAVAGTYVKVVGVFTDDGQNVDWVTDAAGKMTCNKSGRYQFVGDAQIKADKTCTVTLIMFKNGVESPAIGSTPVTFNNANSDKSFGKNKILSAVAGDYFELYAKSTAVSTTITIDEITMQFVELKVF